MINISRNRTNAFDSLIEKAEIGENILTTVRRILDEGEPISDGAPLIYTEKKDGVLPQYDPRTSKWDVAMEAMSRVNAYKVSEYMKDGKPTELVEDTKNVKTETDNSVE